MTEKILNYDETKEKALRLLEFRSHSEKELTDKLKRAGSLDEDIEKTLDFCREYGFVNDALYAKRKAQDLQNLKKYGKHRIKAELKQKGIDAELIELALEELDDDEEDKLYPLVEKKLGGNFDKKNTDKCIRYFIYRGYSFGDIKSCIERAENGGNDEL
jgi:regulatory protein